MADNNRYDANPYGDWSVAHLRDFEAYAGYLDSMREGRRVEQTVCPGQYNQWVLQVRNENEPSRYLPRFTDDYKGEAPHRTTVRREQAKESATTMESLTMDLFRRHADLTLQAAQATLTRASGIGGKGGAKPKQQPKWKRQADTYFGRAYQLGDKRGRSPSPDRRFLRRRDYSPDEYDYNRSFSRGPRYQSRERAYDRYYSRDRDYDDNHDGQYDHDDARDHERQRGRREHTPAGREDDDDVVMITAPPIPRVQAEPAPPVISNTEALPATHPASGAPRDPGLSPEEVHKQISSNPTIVSVPPVAPAGPSKDVTAPAPDEDVDMDAPDKGKGKEVDVARDEKGNPLPELPEETEEDIAALRGDETDDVARDEKGNPYPELPTSP
ncbi:hypothetical protein R3P38DRAFT_2779330 [Favolaschia claudopus]|uniref:Uncharacterized protein n=1 Tax=Favolaschia claudopus TaxID=2862362 RepID=A0AAW0BDG1_9AGAR